MNKVTPKEETAVLLKHGSKAAAILYWWGRPRTPVDDWEFQVCKKWHVNAVKEGKLG